jgi:VTC domain
LTQPPPEIDGTLTSRYECKYLVSEATVLAIRQFISPLMRLDPYSVIEDDLSYRVNSIYFDSPNLRTYQDTIGGIRNRYKIRLRYYASNSTGPVFFEVKKRSDQVVMKSRVAVERSKTEEFLHTGMGGTPEFMQYCGDIGALPAMRIRYFREAYESHGRAPVRLTFDSRLEHSVISDFSLKESRPAWRSTPIVGRILEIKFTERRPAWLEQLISRFQLDKESVAKYVRSIEYLEETGQLPTLFSKLSTSTAWRFRATG